jgi:hypothetical protein
MPHDSRYFVKMALKRTILHQLRDVRFGGVELLDATPDIAESEISHFGRRPDKPHCVDIDEDNVAALSTSHALPGTHWAVVSAAFL